MAGVDDLDAAVHGSRVVGCEERDDVRDVRRRHEAAQRGDPHDQVEVGSRRHLDGVHLRGVHAAGADAVDPDRGPDVLDRQRLGQPDQAVLRAGVRRRVGLTHHAGQ